MIYDNQDEHRDLDDDAGDTLSLALRRPCEESRLQRLAVDLAAIDRETRCYQAKREGHAPWTTFEIPASVERLAA